jgi:hypothetical protein
MRCLHASLLRKEWRVQDAPALSKFAADEIMTCVGKPAILVSSLNDVTTNTRVDWCDIRKTITFLSVGCRFVCIETFAMLVSKLTMGAHPKNIID